MFEKSFVLNLKVGIRIFLSLILTIIFLELIFRTVIFFKSKNSEIYKYGLDRSLKLSFEEVYPLRFTLRKYVNSIKVSKKKINKEKKLKFSIFGGSTTKGWFDTCISNRNFDNLTSSWADEIKKINNDFNFYNFAENGANSDDQLKVLEKIVTDNEVEVILWASKFNMDNILYMSDYPNYDLLKHNFSNRRKNFFFLMINSINKSLSNYIASYKFLNLIILRIRENYTDYSFYSQDINITKDDIYYSVENNKINTRKAIEYSQINDVKKFYIVSLPFRNLRYDFETYQYDLYNEAIIELEKEFKPFVKVINFKNDSVYLKNEELFCDNIHQTPKGNYFQAKHIYKTLLEDEYLNE